MAKKKYKVLRKVRTKGVVYLMQNPDDPLDIKGEVTDLEVMATLKIKKSRFDSYVSVLAPFYKGCILIEKETKDKRYLTNEPVLILTTESDRKYYALAMFAFKIFLIVRIILFLDYFTNWLHYIFIPFVITKLFVFCLGIVLFR